MGGELSLKDIGSARALCGAGVIFEEGTTIGKIPPLGCHVIKSVGISWLMIIWEGPDHFG